MNPWLRRRFLGIAVAIFAAALAIVSFTAVVRFQTP